MESPSNNVDFTICDGFYHPIDHFLHIDTILEINDNYNIFCQILKHGHCFVQVFIIGPVREVRKAEAMLRGRMLETW